MLRGIDNAFDKHDAKALRRPGQNAEGEWARVVRAERDGGGGAGDGGLDWGSDRGTETRLRRVASRPERVGQYLEENAASIEAAKLSPPADGVAAEVVVRLRALALGMRAEPVQSLEELDRTLSVLEEKMFAALADVSGRR